MSQTLDTSLHIQLCMFVQIYAYLSNQNNLILIIEIYWYYMTSFVIFKSENGVIQKINCLFCIKNV